MYNYLHFKEVYVCICVWNRRIAVQLYRKAFCFIEMYWKSWGAEKKETSLPVVLRGIGYFLRKRSLFYFLYIHLKIEQFYWLLLPLLVLEMTMLMMIKVVACNCCSFQLLRGGRWWRMKTAIKFHLQYWKFFKLEVFFRYSWISCVFVSNEYVYLVDIFASEKVEKTNYSIRCFVELLNFEWASLFMCVFICVHQATGTTSNGLTDDWSVPLLVFCLGWLTTCLLGWCQRTRIHAHRETAWSEFCRPKIEQKKWRALGSWVLANEQDKRVGELMNWGGGRGGGILLSLSFYHENVL